MKLVSSAENSSLDWQAQHQYIEDIGDGRGHTAGILGFCSGTDPHAGLDPHFPRDRRRAARDTAFQRAQNDERDRVHFNPAVRQGRTDGLRVLGQFIYYDALVMHGDGTAPTSFRKGLRRQLPPRLTAARSRRRRGAAPAVARLTWPFGPGTDTMVPSPAG